MIYLLPHKPSMNISQNFSDTIAQIYIICVYIPIYLQLGRLCLRYKRKPTILWKVNPNFPYGGLICPKSFIVEKFLQKKENNAYFTKTLAIPVSDTLSARINRVQAFIQEEHVAYPLILKPDDGVGGVGLKFVHNKKALESALREIKKDYVAQEYVSWQNEFSIFFIKHPSQKKGKIRSLTRRSTTKKAEEPELIIPGRKIVCEDESNLITAKITNIFNEISNIPWFYFGRFDIRVKDVQKFLTEGKDFTILEVNVWAHSIALHAFDVRYGWTKRYRIFFDQLRYAFQIADQNANVKSPHHQQHFKDFLKKFMGIFNNS
jgi:hypothetical protein